MEIFVPETKKADYTANDIAWLKQLVILTKVRLTCDDIKDIDLGRSIIYGWNRAKKINYERQIIANT